MPKTKLLLTAVFGPYGVRDDYADEVGLQMELLNNQVTRAQGIHSPRQSYWSFGLYLMAENLSVPTTVLDFPTWDDFTKELDNGYTHVGISYIVPNVLKAGRMAKYIRERHPEIKIILGGYGASLPGLQEMVPHDAVCVGEGIRWLRDYFGEDTEAPLKHPALDCLAFEYIYGFASKPRGSVLMTGLGCENGCTFCCTSHKYQKCYVPLLKTGKDVFDACVRGEDEKRTAGFVIMDENFLKRPERARELLAHMEAGRKPYVFDVFSSANTIEELGVDFLIRLGVRTVWIGVESKTYAHAKKQDVDMGALIKELQDKGIIVLASLILFLEHHDQKSIQEDIDWVISLKSNLVQFMNYTPFPGTSLYESLEQDEQLNDVHYRHQHGTGQLCFDHPHFPDPKDHAKILAAAAPDASRGVGVCAKRRGPHEGARGHPALQSRLWQAKALRPHAFSSSRRDRRVGVRPDAVQSPARTRKHRASAAVSANGIPTDGTRDCVGPGDGVVAERSGVRRRVYPRQGLSQGVGPSFRAAIAGLLVLAAHFGIDEAGQSSYHDSPWHGQADESPYSGCYSFL
ncbi:MAG: hypothetical protein HZB26_10350 [Candidatus Hydrogenedentes bacterium]|nr:hypothetical protein [Candidatus Hydrogenedentota bacterium]